MNLGVMTLLIASAVGLSIPAIDPIDPFAAGFGEPFPVKAPSGGNIWPEEAGVEGDGFLAPVDPAAGLPLHYVWVYHRLSDEVVFQVATKVPYRRKSECERDLQTIRRVALERLSPAESSSWGVILGQELRIEAWCGHAGNDRYHMLELTVTHCASRPRSCPADS